MPTNHGNQLNVQPKHANAPGAVGTKLTPGGLLRPNSYSSAVAGKEDTPKRSSKKAKLGKSYSAPETTSVSAFIAVGEQHKTKHPGNLVE